MKELKQIAAGLALLLTISAPVIAQTDAAAPAAGARQGARGQGRGRGVTAGTIPVATLDYLVKLKDDQKTKIVDIHTKLADDLKAATGDQTKRRELNTKATADIDAILTDDQKAKLKQPAPALGLLQQSRAIPMAVLPDIKLTADQRDKIKDAVKDTQTKLAGVQRGDRAARQPILADFKTKVDAILTDDQKKTIAEKAPRRRAR
jgi:Spy/CpxP family protein refolding chaperone